MVILWSNLTSAPLAAEKLGGSLRAFKKDA